MTNRKFELEAKILSDNATSKERKEMERLDKTERAQLSQVWELTGRLQASPE